MVSPQNAGTSNATNFTITLPIANSSTAGYFQDSIGRAQDNGTDVGTIAEITSSATVVTCYKGLAFVAWTNTGTKFARFVITYQF